MQKCYSFGRYLRDKYNTRVHRISLNAGFNCPNRDGTLSDQGCFFCNEKGFVNFDDPTVSLDQQIKTSMAFFKERFNADKFIAYFQNASNTYAPIEKLKTVYDVIKKYPSFVGLFISTRPDCIDAEKLDLISSYKDKYDVWIEYGLQSIHDKTLEAVNRRHNFEQFKEALEATHARGIKTAAHVILGLPGETKQDMIQTARTLTQLGVNGIKLHIFHILKDTQFAKLYAQGGISLLSVDEYVEMACDFLESLDPECVIMRLVSNAREDVLVGPQWINKKQEILKKINDEFEKRQTQQGSSYNS